DVGTGDPLWPRCLDLATSGHPGCAQVRRDVRGQGLRRQRLAENAWPQSRDPRVRIVPAGGAHAGVGARCDPASTPDAARVRGSSRPTTPTRKLATITAITPPLMINKTRRRTRRRASFPIGLTQAGCERVGVGTAPSVMPHHIETAK